MKIWIFMRAHMQSNKWTKVGLIWYENILYIYPAACMHVHMRITIGWEWSPHGTNYWAPQLQRMRRLPSSNHSPVTVQKPFSERTKASPPICMQACIYVNMACLILLLTFLLMLLFTYPYPYMLNKLRPDLPHVSFVPNWYHFAQTLTQINFLFHSVWSSFIFYITDAYFLFSSNIQLVIINYVLSLVDSESQTIIQ